MTIRKSVVALLFASVPVVLLLAFLSQREDSSLTKNETMAYLLLQALARENKEFNLRKGAYAASLDELPSYKDPRFAKARDAYDFAYKVDGQSFQINGNPRRVGKTGWEYFFADQSGVLRHESSKPAGPLSDAVVQK